MKYCINLRNSDDMLELADEIFVDYRDRTALYTKIEEFPSKTFIICITPEVSVDWTEIIGWSEVGKIIIAFKQLIPEEQIEMLRAHDIGFYFAEKINTFESLQIICQYKPCYIVLDAPLYFSLDKVKRVTDIPIRLFANAPETNPLLPISTITSPFILPQNIKDYEEYVDVLEFYSNSPKQESALLRTYRTGEYRGNLNVLMPNIGQNVDCRFLSTIGSHRTTCGHACMYNSCRACLNAAIASLGLRETLDKIKKI